jgi:hypothetical protein
LIYNPDAANYGILQNISNGLDVTDQQKQFMTTYTFDYIKWAQKCYINAGPAIAELVATQAAISAVNDVFNKIGADAIANLRTNTLSDKSIITPDMIKNMIKDKSDEIEGLKRTKATKNAEMIDALTVQIMVSPCQS